MKSSAITNTWLLTPLMLIVLASSASGDTLQERSAKLKGDEEASKNYSAQHQKFWQEVESRKRAKEAKEKRETQTQQRAAKTIRVSPGECALAFNAAVGKANSFNELISFYSTHYLSTYLRPEDDLEKQLRGLKAAYITDCKVAGKETIRTDGQTDVTLEGYGRTKKTGTQVTLRLIPEDNYWRIVGYSSETGLSIVPAP